MEARDLATTRIAEQARRFPALDLAPLDTSGLEARDAGLAAAIDHAVRRRWLTLVAVVESRLSRPWAELEPRVQAVLLAGAAQLLLLDRLPDHAVLNESVEWAKRRIRPKAGGLVNAVLRKVAGLRLEIVAKSGPPPPEGFPRDELPLHDGRAWKLTEPVFDEGLVRRVAQQTSHPEPLIVHWLGAFGQERMMLLAHHSLVHAPIIVHALGDSGATSMPIAWGGAGLLEPHEQPGFHVFTGEHAALLEMLRGHPAVMVQDPTSAAPVAATFNLQPPPRLIIDACAGVGTKTRQLAALHPAARIIATDLDDERCQVLREHFAGHNRVEVIPFLRLADFNAKADLVLLDVPCSNTGVLARRVEAKYRFSAASLQKTVDLQRQIIADSLRLLSDSARLLYSTCSIEPAENEEQARWVCKWHPVRVAAGRLRWPNGLPGDPPRAYADGGYFAVLERSSKK